MFDTFKNQLRNLTSPATHAAEIVPDDGTDLQHLTRGLYVGATGTVVVLMASGQTVTLSNLIPGVIYPLRVARILATGTTAQGLVAFW